MASPSVNLVDQKNQHYYKCAERLFVLSSVALICAVAVPIIFLIGHSLFSIAAAHALGIFGALAGCLPLWGGIAFGMLQFIQPDSPHVTEKMILTNNICLFAIHILVLIGSIFLSQYYISEILAYRIAEEMIMIAGAGSVFAIPVVFLVDCITASLIHAHQKA